MAQSWQERYRGNNLISKRYRSYGRYQLETIHQKGVYININPQGKEQRGTIEKTQYV